MKPFLIPYLTAIRASRLSPGLIAAGLALATSGMPQARATTWQLNDDWNLTSNSTLTLGSSWALRNADPNQLTTPDARSIGKRGEGINYSADDGKLNFDKGDAISQIFKGLTELDLNDGNQGAFVRFKYWYDHAYESTNGDFTQFDDSGWQDLAKFKGFEVLDLYAWKNFELGERQLSLKLGKQVLSWGEALFLQNGINAINPLDASAFNRPGVELKEGQLPVEMLSFSYDLSDTLSLEGFYQYNFRPTVLDGCGTFFSVGDNIQEGCQMNRLIVVPAGNLSTEQAINARAFETRGSTDWASDDGQYGLALRKTLEMLNDAELGIYYANYHSRTPSMDGRVRTGLSAGSLPTGTYNTVYPEDIRLFGISLSGVLGSTAVFTELSYRPNQPLSYNASDVVAVVAGAGASTPIYDGTTPSLGSEVQGYKRKEVWQYSLGATDNISNIFGAEKLTWIAEAGANWIEGIDLDEERYGRAALFGRVQNNGAACFNPAAGGLNAGQAAEKNADFCNTHGYTTGFSWGYRLRAALAFESLIPAMVVTPSLNFRHDVEGYGPNFQEGQMAAGAALTFDYRNNYSLELAYNDFFGSNKFSTIDDRDFASVNLKVSF
ncbi:MULTISPECIES: DUF1302 domain-containing protein [Pseudomonas]|uniref:DUF1302 domain-containing protein n=1 Tax=Pseudomonas TaxID=286 RepID=UPI0006860C2A|nr:MULTISPECIES: DUF1302 domain-containing protein [Pseudomonas]MCW2268912.1 hypothetical protein [Pseudomonas sp. JUb96]